MDSGGGSGAEVDLCGGKRVLLEKSMVSKKREAKERKFALCWVCVFGSKESRKDNFSDFPLSSCVFVFVS